jgi:hypothetical protein
MKVRDIRRLKSIIKLLDVARNELSIIEKVYDLVDEFSDESHPDFASRIASVIHNLELNIE